MVAVFTSPPQARQSGELAVLQEARLQLVQLVALAALQADGVGGVAVQLDDLAVGHAGVLVQVVDVLGDDARHFARARTSRATAQWPAIGLGARPAGCAAKCAPPGLAALSSAGDEILEVDRLHLGSIRRRGCGNRECRIRCEMPAPVNTTARRERSSIWRNSEIPLSSMRPSHLPFLIGTKQITDPPPSWSAQADHPRFSCERRSRRYPRDKPEDDDRVLGEHHPLLVIRYSAASPGVNAGTSARWPGSIGCGHQRSSHS